MKIESLWSELEQSITLPAFRRIDENHPLNIYAGVDESHNLLLLLVTDCLAPELGTFQSLTIHRARREDSQWAYTIVLDDRKLSPMFALLCADLIKTTESISPKLAITQFFARLGRWKALLASGDTGLSEQEVRGLLAELYVLHRFLAPHFGIDACIAGWAGPEAEEQDFRLENRSFEVKAVATGKTRIRVASLRQLDCLGGSLDLLVIPVNPASQTKGETLASLIGTIRASLAESSESGGIFESKLMLAGYTEDDAASTKPYMFGTPIKYAVTEKFPRLIPAAVSEGVVEAAYTIDLTFCSEFQKDFSL